MNKRIIWIGMACFLFIASAGLIIYYLWGNGYLGPTKTAAPTPTYTDFTYPSIDDSVMESVIKSIEEETEETKTGETTEPSTNETTIDEITCPVNFDELQAVNPDIIGWLYMTSPEISLPILRSPTDDTTYLYKDAVGEYSKEGSLFVEHQYNSDDFSDIMTVVYGHRMSNGTMFGTMQATVTEDGFFDENRYIVIFTPKEIKKYQIFATFPSDNKHLLYYNNFTIAEEYAKFIDDVYSRSGSEVRLVEEAKPKYGDRILVLSSCLWGDRTSRFLVLAKEVG